jgi:hypothetical protein
MICWENKTKPLEHCIISTHNYNSSNVLSHLKPNPKLASDVSTVTDSLANKSATLVQNQISQYTQNPNDVVVGLAQISLFEPYVHIIQRSQHRNRTCK